MLELKNQVKQYVAATGTSFYYSIRHLPQDKQQALIAVQQFAVEINHIAETYKSQEVATEKLKWWAEEVTKLYQEKASHPIAVALQPIVISYNIKDTVLLAIIEAAQMSLHTQLFANQAELSAHYQHTGGILEAAKLRICSDGAYDEQLEKYAHTLGVVLETIRHLRDFPVFWSRQHIYFPEDDLKKIDVTVESLNKNIKPIQPLIQAQADHARALLSEAEEIIKDLPKTQGLKMTKVYAKCKLKWLEKTQNDGFQLLKHRLRLMPLRKLWMSVL